MLLGLYNHYYYFYFLVILLFFDTVLMHIDYILDMIAYKITKSIV